jgi:hypothetical protein
MLLGTILGTILIDTVKAIIGNRTDSLLMDSLGAIKNNFENPEKRLMNHDLQKAVARSFYLAKSSICKECIDKEKGNTKAIEWLKNTNKEIKNALRQIQRDDYTALPIEDIDNIRLLLSTEETSLNYQKKIADYATEEECNSRLYNELVRHSFYQRVCGLFASEIKHNNVVNHIFDSQLLVTINTKINDITNILLSKGELFLPELKNIEAKIAEENKSIEEIHELLLSSFVDFGYTLNEIKGINEEIKTTANETKGTVEEIKIIDEEILEKINHLMRSKSGVAKTSELDIDQIISKIASVFTIAHLYSFFINNTDECFETGFNKIFSFSLEDSLNKLTSILQTAIKDCFYNENYKLPFLCQEVIAKQLFSLGNAMQYLSAKHSLKLICKKLKEILIENDSSGVFIELKDNIVENIINIIVNKIENDIEANNELISISEYRFTDELLNNLEMLMNFINKQEAIQLLIHRFAINYKKEISFFSVYISADSRKFFGRDEKLAEMWDEFNTGKQVLILWGMDGIGKTSLAKNFVNVYEKYIGETHKVEIESNTQGDSPTLLHTIIQGYQFPKDFVDKCKQSPKEKEYELKSATLHELSEDDLIFIDNVKTITEKDIDDLMEFNCKFIITSPKNIDHEQVALIEVKKLDFCELRKVFENNLKYSMNNEDEEKLRLLFENVYYHTLVVKLLARLMRYHKKTIDELIEISENMIADTSQIEGFYNSDTIIGHLLNIYDITQITPSEKRFLNNLALVSSKGIEDNKFLKWLNLENKNELNSLYDLSWVIYDKNTLNIRLHPIITSTLLAAKSIDPNDCKETINGIISMLDFKECTSFVELENLLEYGQYLKDTLDKLNYSEHELLYKLSEGYSYLGKHNKSIEIANIVMKSPDMQKAPKVIILIANISINKWDYDSAIKHYNQAIEYANGDNIECGSRYVDIAKCYLALGNTDCASKAFLNAHDSYMNASHTFGAGLALINYFGLGNYSFHYSKKLNKYKDLVLKSAVDDPNNIILYLCSYVQYMAKKKKIISNVMDVEEIIHGTFLVIEHYFGKYRFKYFLKNYIKRINASTNESLSIVEELISNDYSDSDTEETETLEFIQLIEWMESHCLEIGQHVDIAQVLGMAIELFPEFSLNSEVIRKYLEEKFRYFKQRLLIDNALIVQSIIAFAHLEGRLLGNKIELENIKNLLKIQIDILPIENQYSLALSYEALGNWYLSENNRNNSPKRAVFLNAEAKHFFKSALEIKQKIGVNPVEEARLLNKIGNYRSAIKLLEDNSYKNCTLCESYISLAEYLAREEKEANEIMDCIKKVNQISRNVSTCYKMCRANTLFRLAFSLKCSSSKPRHIHIFTNYLNICSFIITQRLKIVNKFAVQNCMMIIKNIKESKLDKLSYIVIKYFINEGLILAKKNRDYQEMTNLLIEYLDEKNIGKYFFQYKKRKLKSAKHIDKNNLLLLYNNQMKKDDFSLFILQQIQKTDYQEIIITTKKIPLLIDKVTEKLFDSYLLHSHRFKGL